MWFGGGFYLAVVSHELHAMARIDFAGAEITRFDTHDVPAVCVVFYTNMPGNMSSGSREKRACGVSRVILERTCFVGAQFTHTYHKRKSYMTI